MEHKEAKQRLDALLANQQDSTRGTRENTKEGLQKKPLSRARVVRILSHLQARYTHRWQSAIENDEVYALVVTDWMRELSGLKDSQIAHGLSLLPVSWPPTCGEFRLLCTGENEEDGKRHDFNGYAKRIEFEKPRNRRIAKDACNKMRRILRGRQT